MEPLRLLIGENKLTEKDLELVWEATQIDEQMRLQIYKVFGELTLRKDDVDYVVRKISDLPLNRLLGEEVELVTNLAKKLKGSPDESGKVVNWLLKIAIESGE